MAAPITLQELSNILEAELSPEDETTWNNERLNAILTIINQSLVESNLKLDSDFRLGNSLSNPKRMVARQKYQKNRC